MNNSKIELDPGHEYAIREIGLKDGQTDERKYTGKQLLVFVKREGDGYPGNIGHHPGVTTQELLRVVAMRMEYVDKQEHAFENDEVVYHLTMAMFYLELRAAKRHGLATEFLRSLNLNEKTPVNYALPEDDCQDVSKIMDLEPCTTCGHVVCLCVAEEVKL
jgi:hypothetical protein